VAGEVDSATAEGTGPRTGRASGTWPADGGDRQKEPGLVFTGEYRHTVDAKARLAVPSKFRAQLAGGAMVSRWLDLCLAIWPRDGWERLASRVAALPTVENPGARAFSRFVFASAVEIEFDAQGRFVLPAYLREAAGLEGEAVVVGSLDHAEIWAPARWEEYRKALEVPDALAKHLAGLGI
jgi:MraZ protein